MTPSATTRPATPSGAFGARGASSRTEAPRFRVGRPSPLALRRARLTTTTTIRITSTTRRIPTIAADSTGPRRPVGPLSREDQARADALEQCWIEKAETFLTRSTAENYILCTRLRIWS